MKNTSYQIGFLRDRHGENPDSNIFELCLDVIQSAKGIRDSYNTPISMEMRFDDLNISTAASLSYAIWHLYSKLETSHPG